MNPPFADGDAHLIKALEIQKDGGSIVCLLNAETLRNPYTNRRKILMRELDKYEAQIEYVENAFRNAERKAEVEVAIVRVTIPMIEKRHSTIWERMEKAEEDRPLEEKEVTDLVAGDYIEQAVTRFNVEVAASLDLINQYQALRPYILESLDPDASYNSAILTLSVGRESNWLQNTDIYQYLKTVRLKYWSHLFRQERFVGKLTSQLRKEYVESVERMKDYDFTLYNIKTVMIEMNSQVIDGVKGAILNLFDKLTADHSYYPECAQNVHYYNGWKTNKAHKIGKKSIIPTYGMFSNSSWSDGKLDTYTAYSVLIDIEKIFNYLSGVTDHESNLRFVLERAKDTGNTRNIELRYFTVDLYKKGTTHIKYKDMDLIDKFNIYAARNRNWLPPNYGRSTYKEMTDEERAVVDDFQGEKAYEKVMVRSDYFLSEPTQELAMIPEKSSVEPPLMPLDEPEDPEPVQILEIEEPATEAAEEAETIELVYCEENINQLALF